MTTTPSRPWTPGETVRALFAFLTGEAPACPVCAGALLTSDGATLHLLYCPQCRRGCSQADRKEGQ